MDDLATLTPQEKRRLLADLLRRKTAAPRLTPLSFAQQRLWFLDQIDPGNPSYNMFAGLHMRGPIDIAAFVQSFKAIARRQDSLRTSFRAIGGTPMQVVAPSGSPPMRVVDLLALPASLRERIAIDISGLLARRSFDLSRGPLLRIWLFLLDADEHVLALTLHHIIADGWSIDVFLREFVAHYVAATQGREAQLPQLPIQYADYAAWQRQKLQGETLDRHLRYWREQLGGDLPVLDLPADRPRPAVQTLRGGSFLFIIDPPAIEALRALNQRTGVTMFMSLLAGFQALLHRYSEQNDIVIGVPSANRDRTEIEGLIGFFVNTLVLRAGLGDDPTFQQLALRARDITLAAHAHKDLPFEKLVEELHPERDLGQLTPFFRVMFQHQFSAGIGLKMPDIAIRAFNAQRQTAQFDLSVDMAESPQGVGGAIEYNTDLFDRTTIQRLARHFQALLAGGAANPSLRLSDLPLLAASERAQLLLEWNDAAAGGRSQDSEVRSGLADSPPSPSASVYLHTGFAAQAARSPDAVAVLFDTGAIAGEGRRTNGSGERAAPSARPAPAVHLTYGALNRRANQLAQHLRARGVGPEVRVGLCMDRSPELLIGLLGILKAGGAFVPLDPSHPRARRDLILADAGSPVLLTQRRLLDDPPALAPEIVCLDGDWNQIAAQPAEDRPGPIAPDQLAYVIYTSGSTGSPKGALAPHRSATSHVEAAARAYALRPGDVALHFAAITFDVALEELFAAWSRGAAVVAGSEGALLAFDDLLRLIDRTRATVLNLPAPYWHDLASHMEHTRRAPPASARLLIVGSEQVSAERLAAWRKLDHQGVRLLNAYGTTETSVTSTLYDPLQQPRGRSGALPIGRPLANTRVYVLDRNMRPAPIGVAGELYIGGSGVTRGYLGRPDLTAERFIPNPFAPTNASAVETQYLASLRHTRLYKTGDRARFLPDGSLEFLGRRDDQVKVRGVRIELGEIAATLRGHPAVRDAIILAIEDGGGGRSLAAYAAYDPSYRTAGEQALEAEIQSERLAQWQAVHDDDVFNQIDVDSDPAFNISGWNSSYTGLPIPAEEMREWVAGTVARIRALRPRRVLEIGCGTGLLLFQLAPECELYCGTDFSKAALDYVEQIRATPAHALPQVELFERAADDFSGMADASFDTIILNSVVQYFPDVEYLVRVLAEAVRVVKPGGHIFIGDVRNLALLEAFHASVQLHKAPAALAAAELAQRVRKQIFQEAELLLDPDFFAAFKSRNPGVSDVQLALRRGRAHNELTRFRYDVIITLKSPVAAPAEALRLDWREQALTLDALRQILAEQRPERVYVGGVPNARVIDDWRAARLLAQHRSGQNAGGLRAALRQDDERGVDPEEIWSIGDELPYAIRIGWAAAHDAERYDVFCVRNDVAETNAAPPIADAGPARPLKPWNEYANNPLQEDLARHLVPELRAFLRERLPAVMAPAHIVVLDALPRTPGGKIDRAALRDAESLLPASDAAYVAPQTEIERTIAAVWQSVLLVESVGLYDNFFDLGGHSLLLIQVQSKLREVFKKDISVIELFQYPTISALAQRLAGERADQPALQRSNERAELRRARVRHEDVAIVGMVGRFPGARDLDQFWANLRDGIESIRFFTDEELAADGVDASTLADLNYVRAKGMLDDVDLFDAGLFDITPREAEIIDPQQRVFLECAWAALEAAGYDPETYAGRIGVYAGVTMSSYLLNILSNPELVRLIGGYQIVIDNAQDALNTRVSYKLNLRGPSVNVNTACSTSLVAVHQACQSLLTGECDLALAGGSTINFPQKRGYLYQEGMIASPDGHCRAFDARAQGTVSGNGVGIVALKRLADALADGDTIHAIIKGSAINNDGSLKVGYTAPSVEGQAEVIAEAQAIAGVDSATISYVEAHGTGTPLGDPIEIAALTQAFRASTDKRRFCAIGSVKTNVGHLDTAAGVAGLIKTVLALEHELIPPSLHFESPNPKIDFANSPFYVNAALAEWKSNGTPRRAGVSSFGIGGTNAHVVVEEAPPVEPSGASRAWQILTLSAKTGSALDALTERLAERLERDPAIDLADAAYTLQVGRKALPQRRMLVCRDRTDALATLRGRDPARLISAPTPARRRAVAFLFPGQGSQYVRMAADLYRSEATFREIVDQCCAILRPQLGRDLREALYPATEDQRAGVWGLGSGVWGEGPGTEDIGGSTNSSSDSTNFNSDSIKLASDSTNSSSDSTNSSSDSIKLASDSTNSSSDSIKSASSSTNFNGDSTNSAGDRMRSAHGAASDLLDQTQYTQPALFVIEYALARLWMSWGIQPQAMLGHSIGEYVAATLAGVFSLEDALALVAQRGRILQRLPEGAMLAVALPEAEVEALLGEQLSLAAVNGPASCVVSGPVAAIGALEQDLARRDVRHQRLRTARAFHSRMLEPVVRMFAEQVGKVRLSAPKLPFISNVSGTWISAAQATDPGYWARQLRQTVRFADGLAELLKESERIFLEVGPGRTLGALAGRHPARLDSQIVLASLPRPQEQQPDVAFVLDAAGKLWLAGAPLDWRAFYAKQRRRRIALPTYPFERQRYFIEPAYQPIEAGSRTLTVAPRPAPAVRPANDPSAPPSNDFEQAIAIIWEELLGITTIGVHDSFFDLGGDSLMATQLVARLRELFEVELPLQTFFAHPTIARMAQAIEALLIEKLAGMSDEDAQLMM